MKNWILLIGIILMAKTMNSQSIEVAAAYGHTAIDIESLVDQDEIPNTVATDWGLTNYGFGLQYVFPSKSNMNLGLELMYQYLYWYSVKVPYGVQPIYRDYEVAATRITPFLRFGAENPLNLDLGLEFNSIDDLAMGVMASGNYYIPLSDNFNLGLKVRLDLINYTVFTPAVSFNFGFKYDIE